MDITRISISIIENINILLDEITLLKAKLQTTRNLRKLSLHKKMVQKWCKMVKKWCKMQYRIKGK